MTSRTIIRIAAGICLAIALLCTGISPMWAQEPPAPTDSTAAAKAQQGTAGTQQNTTGIQAAQQNSLPSVPHIARVLTDAAGIGGILRLQLDSASAAAIEQNLMNYRELELFLDGMRFHSLNPKFMAPNILIYDLEYDDSSRSQWRVLLGSLDDATHVTRIGMGYEGQSEILPASTTTDYIPTFTFVIYRKGWFVVAMIGVLLAIVLFWLLAIKSDIIRDANPPEPEPGQRRPYSLARFQMAVWFFVVIMSYMFIFLLTGQYNSVLNDQSLILMGIGAGTALGAAMIDSNKNSTARTSLNTLNSQKSKLDAELRDLHTQLIDTERSIAALQPPPAADGTTPAPSATATEQLQEFTQTRQNLKGEIADKKSQAATLAQQIHDIFGSLRQPVSEGFLRDLLTDNNGISFHRFQILAWTTVLVAIFCTEVYRDLLMPEFSVTLLALMGISSGTYLGFKVPEQQTQPTPATTQTTQTNS